MDSKNIFSTIIKAKQQGRENFQLSSFFSSGLLMTGLLTAAGCGGGGGGGGGGGTSRNIVAATPQNAATLNERATSSRDIADYSAFSQSQPITFDLEAGTVTIAGTEHDVSNFEGAYGGAGADTLTGNDEANTFHGGAGNDMINGGAGNDIINGGMDDAPGDPQDGNDRLTGGEGVDRFVFRNRSGDDVITDFEVGVDIIDIAALFEDTSERVDAAINEFFLWQSFRQEAASADISSGNLVFTSTDETISYGGVEIGVSYAGSLTIEGSFTMSDVDSDGDGTISVDEYIEALGGHSNLYFGSDIFTEIMVSSNTGDDQSFIGTRRSDVILGGDGDDIIFGAAGNDIISGGTGIGNANTAEDGDDVLIGGRGADTFVFSGNTGDDMILDFQIGIDRIDLSYSGIPSSTTRSFFETAIARNLLDITETDGNLIFTFTAGTVTVGGRISSVYSGSVDVDATRAFADTDADNSGDISLAEAITALGGDNFINF